MLTIALCSILLLLGDVGYEEFVEFFYAMKAEDPHSMRTLIKSTPAMGQNP